MPTAGWEPPQRTAGQVVMFVSDDGSQRKDYDFATLEGSEAIKGELLDAFSEAVGHLGGMRRESSARGLWTVVRKTARWIALNRPNATSLSEILSLIHI